ncbi:MAG TPA: hypothetical protein DEA45_00515 [Acholeplasmataceae bacterium]|nr:hypothetical protein [Acholeplasmataceae bacterium]
MDLKIVEWFQSNRNDVLDQFFGLVTEFGGDLIFLVIGTLILWLYDKKVGFRFMVIFLFTLGFNDVFKNIIRRPRPFIEGAVSVGEETYGYAMPSAHASNVSMLGLLSLEAFKPKVRWLSFVVYPIIILVLISRIYLGQHYLSDVIVGFIYALAFYHLIKTVGQNIKLHYTKVILIGLSVLLIPMIVFGMFYKSFNIASPNSFRNLFIAFGSILGLTIGHIIEEKHVKYVEKAPMIKQIVKYLIGLIIAVAIQEGFKRILPYPLEESIFTLILDAIRYFLLTIWLTLGAPYVFKLIIKEARVD